MFHAADKIVDDDNFLRLQGNEFLYYVGVNETGSAGHHNDDAVLLPYCAACCTV